MLWEYGSGTRKINKIVNENAPASFEEYWSLRIRNFIDSLAYTDMLEADRYYKGIQDILYRKREMKIEGETIEIANLPNNHIVDNQYAKAVDEKKNYIIAKPLTITTSDDKYSKILHKDYFNAKMHRLLNRVVREGINLGVSYLYPYYDNGKLNFKKFHSWEIMVDYTDEDKTEVLDFGRVYTVEKIIGGSRQYDTYFEYYDKDGVKTFLYDGDLHKLTQEEETSYLRLGETEYSWEKIPLIVFRRNENEMPLLKAVKSLQDAINEIESNFVNVMDEDIRSTIMVLINYDGENLAEFREKLTKYGAVKVTTIDGQGGDVKTLKIDVNPENYKAILGILKEALIENARSFNVKDNRLTSDANQMHIQSAYHDMDLDADDMEVEWQAALEDLQWFIDFDIRRRGLAVPKDNEVTFTFNRNMMIDETSIIQNCVVSKDIISDETIRRKHPWCVDPQREAELLEEQQRKELSYNPIEDMRNASDGD